MITQITNISGAEMCSAVIVLKQNKIEFFVENLAFQCTSVQERQEMIQMIGLKPHTLASYNLNDDGNLYQIQN